MQSDADVARARRLKVLRGVGFGTTVAVCAAVVVYTFVR
jgi:hypothetical protein